MGCAPGSIAVNVSALQFAQADFLKSIDAALTTCGSETPWLEIELTESLLMKNMRDATEKLKALRGRGVTIAIDDFGTGYSSMAYLQRLSLETLKINQVFFEMVEAGNAQSTQKSIARAIVALAKSLGLKVVAEGVETDAHRAFLIDAGADLMQGYFFSVPLSVEEIEPMLRTGMILVNGSLAMSA
jgi:EAL domain-containing protein (putative c-di-GMP-specific phosphodiesterase class I)